MNQEFTPVDILQEPLPLGTSILIVGPPGSGKTIVSQQLMHQVLKRGESVIYIASKSQTTTINSQKTLFKWNIADYLDNNQLKMVEIGDIADPTELNISLSRAINRVRSPLSLVVVDSLTVLMVVMELKKIMKFAEGLTRKLRDQNINLLLLVTPTSETEDFVTKMKSLVSSVVDISLDETGTIRRYIRIFKFLERRHSTRWYPFEITEKGVQFPSSAVRTPDTFLFDLDGTLVTMELDFEAIRRDIDAILVEGGYPEEFLDVKVSTLETIKQAVEYLQQKGFDWKEVQEKANTFLEQTEQKAALRAVPLPGAENVLKILKDRRKKVGIITRNNREVALQVLKKCGLFQYVDVVLARNDVGKVKPHPDHVAKAIQKLGSSPEKSVVLGDHHYEIEAGNKAGCFTVGFLTGSGTRETLADADIILNSITDLEQILTVVGQ